MPYMGDKERVRLLGEEALIGEYLGAPEMREEHRSELMRRGLMGRGEDAHEFGKRMRARKKPSMKGDIKNK